MPSRDTTKTFIEKCCKIHNNKYDYSQVHYVNRRMNVKIICPTHGIFVQQAGNHVHGYGCKSCGILSRTKKSRLTNAAFIKKSQKLHNNKYDYSKTKYVNHKAKVIIICPIHGEFLQCASKHLLSKGCPRCAIITAGMKNRSTTEEFIAKSQKVHGHKYDYSKVKYEGSHHNVIIVCSIHGEFLKSPNSHLKGYGCNLCK